MDGYTPWEIVFESYRQLTKFCVLRRAMISLEICDFRGQVAK